MACTPQGSDLPVADSAERPPPSRVADLWDWATPDDNIWLEEVIVTSGRTESQRFFVQDPEGGPASGLAIDVRGEMHLWPPEIGTPVELLGRFSMSDQGPVLELLDQDDGRTLGEPTTPVAWPWSRDPALHFSLVTAEVRVTSAADPLGHADTDLDLGLDGTFTLELPGFGSSGQMTGILVEANRIAPRAASDWAGDWATLGSETVTISQLRSGDWADGTPVRLDGVQITPWSRDGRNVVVQDDGGGLWIDTEAWLTTEMVSGLRAWWEGEIRTDEAGPYLRTWRAPTPIGTGVARVDSLPSDGALVELTVNGLGAPDRLGERTTKEGFTLDDRFVSLDDLADPSTIRGVMRGDALICVLD